MKLLFALLLIVTTSVSAKELNNKEITDRIDILADEINQLKAYQMFINKNESVYGLSPSASKVYHIPRGLSVGGYGEITYLHSRAENESGDATNTDPKAEVLRNILYVGYKFDDKWLINMELEIEHVSQVYTEFMYLDYLHSKEVNFRAGLMLHPIGYVNELHEPTVYPGVLRPTLETVIIPTTWRSLGVGAFGQLGANTNYKFYVMNGMGADGFTTSSNRGARKRGGHYDAGDNDAKRRNQRANTGVAVWRLDHSFTDEFTVGTSGLIGAASGDNENLDQTMLTLQAEYVTGAHHLRFLAVENRFGNADDYNEVSSNQVNTAQQGAYLEYKYTIDGSGTSKYIPFIRYEVMNLQADRAEAVANNDALESNHLTVGLNYFPLDRVVLKADYTVNRNKAETGTDVFALGLGYNF
jgi:hypothetical protein